MQGHIFRMQETRMVRRVLEAKRYGKRRKERPRVGWLEQLIDIGKEKGMIYQQMKELAGDGMGWKRWD